MTNAIKEIVDNFIDVYKYCGIHVSKPQDSDKLVDLTGDLYEAIIQTAYKSIADLTDLDYKHKLHYIVAVGNALAIECAEYFNKAEIPVYQPFDLKSGPPAKMDGRFFLINLVMVDKDRLPKEVNDIIDMYILIDRYANPNYFGPSLAEMLGKHIQVSVPDDKVKNLIPMEDIADKDVMKEFFKTFSDLGTYIREGKYDDPNAKILYNRINDFNSRICSVIDKN